MGSNISANFLLESRLPCDFHLKKKLTNNSTLSEKKKWMNEWMKSHKSALVVQCFSFLSKPERTYWSLTPQLDTVVIEISLVKALRLRGNLRRSYMTRCLPSWNGTYGDTGFYSGQTSYLALKVLVKMRICDSFLTTANLSYNPKCWHFSDHTNFILTCSSGALHNN